MFLTTVNPFFIPIEKDLVRIQDALDDGNQMAIVASKSAEDIASLIIRDSVGGAIHHAYCGYEHIFEIIAQDFDHVKPSGIDWHMRLLQQMNTELPGRPAIIPNDLFEYFDDYRAFRHYFRNSYGKQPRKEELLEKLAIFSSIVHPGMIDHLQYVADVIDGVRPRVDVDHEPPRP